MSALAEKAWHRGSLFPMCPALLKGPSEPSQGLWMETREKNDLNHKNMVSPFGPTMPLLGQSPRKYSKM